MESNNTKLAYFLNLITLGKYKTNFSFKGRQDHTTVIGMIVTLILYSLLFFAAIVIFKNIFTYKEYQLDSRNTDKALTYSADEFTKRMGLQI